MTKYDVLYKWCPGLRNPCDMTEEEMQLEYHRLSRVLVTSELRDVSAVAFVLLRLQELLGESTGEPLETVLAESGDDPSDPLALVRAALGI